MISTEEWYTKKKANILEYTMSEDSPDEFGQSIANFIRKINQ